MRSTWFYAVLYDLQVFAQREWFRASVKEMITDFGALTFFRDACVNIPDFEYLTTFVGRGWKCTGLPVK